MTLKAQQFQPRPALRRATPGALSIVLGAAFILSACGEALAVNPPRITNISFDQATQQLSFTTHRGPKDFANWSVSSDGDTVFDPNPPTGVNNTPGVGGVESNTQGATPGNTAQAGEIHKLTITVTNDNGQRSRVKLLRVVPAGGRAALIYEEVYAIPTVSQWGLAVMVLLLLTAATMLLARNRHSATT